MTDYIISRHHGFLAKKTRSSKGEGFIYYVNDISIGTTIKQVYDWIKVDCVKKSIRKPTLATVRSACIDAGWQDDFVLSHVNEEWIVGPKSKWKQVR